jgi:hypothetical protein
MIAGLRKLCNEEFRNFYFSPNIIRVSRQSGTRKARHATYMQDRREMHIEFWWESQKIKYH